uniref:Uncharacterized protein n=1 Tax=Physcomitrium patens TaxID=3218 RepID=A0A7I4ERK3_PHYPA
MWDIHIGTRRPQLSPGCRHPASVDQGYLRGRRGGGIHAGGARDRVRRLQGRDGLLSREELLGHGRGHHRREANAGPRVSRNGHREDGGCGDSRQHRLAACSRKSRLQARRRDA